MDEDDVEVELVYIDEDVIVDTIVSLAAVPGGMYKSQLIAAARRLLAEKGYHVGDDRITRLIGELLEKGVLASCVDSLGIRIYTRRAGGGVCLPAGSHSGRTNFRSDHT